MYKLELINVCKSYDTYVKEEVLKDINLKVKDREFISIMGPSGSGKSTLLYILGTLEKRTNGIVIINGEDITSFSDNKLSEIRRQEVGFIYQSYNLVKHLNVLENIMLPILLDNKNSKEYIKDALEILDYLELSHKSGCKPIELSGGQQQRVAIGRALINDPNIILADEATGNLDSKTGNDIMNLLSNLNKDKKKTIVQVTHSLECAQFGNRIVNIKDGRIVKM